MKSIYTHLEPTLPDIAPLYVVKRTIAIHLLAKNHTIHLDLPKTKEGIENGISLWNEYTNIHDYKKILSYFFPKKKKKIDYLITLSSNTNLNIDDFKTSFNRIKKYKKFKITSIYGVIEFTKNGLPHLHIYSSGDNYIELARLKILHKKSAIDIRRAFNKKGLDKYLSKDENLIRLT